MTSTEQVSGVTNVITTTTMMNTSDHKYYQQQLRILESASMLVLYSMFALIEGTIRLTTNSRPSLEVDYFDTAGGTIIPVFVFLLGGIAEVYFGMAGVFVGLFAVILRRGRPRVTLYFTISQAILGWFVFLTYQISAPILLASNATGVPGLLTPGEEGTLAILGTLVAGGSLCWALQGGQFIMALQLLAAQQGQEPVLKSKNVTRAIIWSVNVLLTAASTLYVGFKLVSMGFNSSTVPIAAPPHIVWYPAIPVVTGIVTVVYGVMGLLAAQNKSIATNWLPLAFVVTTVALMINFSWTFGILPGFGPPIVGALQHTVLILSTTILPLYHAWRAHYGSVPTPVNSGSAPIGTNSSQREETFIIKKKKMSTLEIPFGSTQPVEVRESAPTPESAPAQEIHAAEAQEGTTVHESAPAQESDTAEAQEGTAVQGSASALESTPAQESDVLQVKEGDFLVKESTTL